MLKFLDLKDSILVIFPTENFDMLCNFGSACEGSILLN